MPEPAVPSPQLPDFPPPGMEKGKQFGCLRWGLLGCAGLSVLMIIGLMFLTMRAKSLIGWAFERLEGQVIAASAPGVTPAQKEEFKSAMKAFVEKARDGKAATGNIQKFQGEVMDSVKDGRVTAEEMEKLTRVLKEGAR